MKQPTIANKKVTRYILQRFGIHMSKRLGQNFLIDANIVQGIVDAANVQENDRVLEIGPGIGTLTQALAETGAEVTCVELDKRLPEVLAHTLDAYDNVRVIQGDILKVNIPEIMGDKPFKVVANLPYYITTPIIMALLEKHLPITDIVVMVQKEVADRMKVGPGTKDYGALSLAVQYYAEPYIVANVPPNCFMPRPKVGSAVIRLTRHEKPPVEVADEKLMFRLIRASFNQRRKTLANGLNNSPELSYSKEEIQQTIEKCGFKAGIRGEPLTLEDFAKLANVFSEK